MLVLLSPSKTQNSTDPSRTNLFQKPLFENKRWQLVRQLQKLDKKHIMEMMKISEKLADENLERIVGWNKTHTDKNAKPAIETFTGAVYKDFENTELSEKQYNHAQKQIRILSGLYGMLRPLDLMQPYRLEMGTRGALTIDGKEYKNLYQFWSESVTSNIADDSENDVILNLASIEYSKVIDRKKIQSRWVDVEFYQEDAGELKQVTIYTKQERGAMAAWIAKEMISDAEKIKQYNQNGYSYARDLSKEDILVFIRPKPQ